jgi:hypothetical protein
MRNIKQISVVFFATIFALSMISCAKTAKVLSASELLSLGEKYLLELDYEQAVVQFLNVIEIEPKNPRGYLGAAEAYIELGQTDKAIDVLSKGLSELPDNAEIAALLNDLTVTTPTPEIIYETIPPTLSTPEPDIETMTGVIVQADLSAFTGPTYKDGFKFKDSVITPSGESVSVARIDSGISVFGEWIIYDNSIPQFSDSAYNQIFEITGRLSFDETHSNGIVPHPNPSDNNGSFVNDPWGPWQLEILSVEVITSISATPAAVSETKDIFPTMSKAEHKALHTFFSNFSEVGMNHFDSANYSDAELIEFAIWHTYRNNSSLIDYSSEDGRGKISADTIKIAIEKYFGCSITNLSIGFVDNPNFWNYGQYTYEYKNDYYYFMPADGDPLKWSQVTSIIDDGNGTYSAYVDVYWGQEVPDNIYEDIADWNLAGGLKITHKGEGQGDVWEGPCYYYSVSAVIAPHTHNGKETYKLISLGE